MLEDMKASSIYATCLILRVHNASPRTRGDYGPTVVEGASFIITRS